MRAVFATSNADKLRELRRALPGWEIGPIGPHAFPGETGETFYDNALIKAGSARASAPSGTWVIGEDSGLVVDGLGGLPGIHSARWAGEGAGQAEWLAKLLSELEGIHGEGRRARYVSELVALSPDGVEVRGSGTLEGRIAEQPSGRGGFGYDPVFIPEGETQSVGELGDEWKAEHSHRTRAARALRRALEAL